MSGWLSFGRKNTGCDLDAEPVGTCVWPGTSPWPPHMMMLQTTHFGIQPGLWYHDSSIKLLLLFTNFTSQAEGELNAKNVMDYFETSPFWDSSSTNAMVKMQNQYSNIADVDTEDQLTWVFSFLCLKLFKHARHLTGSLRGLNSPWCIPNLPIFLWFTNVNEKVPPMVGSCVCYLWADANIAGSDPAYGILHYSQ